VRGVAENIGKIAETVVPGTLAQYQAEAGGDTNAALHLPLPSLTPPGHALLPSSHGLLVSPREAGRALAARVREWLHPVGGRRGGVQAALDRRFSRIRLSAEASSHRGYVSARLAASFQQGVVRDAARP
jgi:hypothetical protein